MRRAARVLFFVGAGSLAGCPPTLSAPRGEDHLTAMAEADRHHSAGRDGEAIDAWGRAADSAERRVDRDEAEHRAALSLRTEGRLDEALALFDAIAAREPVSRRTVRAMFEAARIRLTLGQRDAALAALRGLCFDHPGEGQASRSLTILLRELRSAEGDDAAIALLRALDESVRATDLGDDVLTELAAILRERHERDAARALYERIVAEHPYPTGQRWDDTFMRLADMAEEDGDPEAAVRYLERMIAPHALGLAPGSYTLPHMPDAALRIARILRDRIHDPERAALAFQRTYDEFPTSLLRDDALVELGELQLDGGHSPEGCETLARAIREYEVGAAARRARERHASACAGAP